MAHGQPAWRIEPHGWHSLRLLIEVLFGLFCAYTIYRAMRLEVFVYAELRIQEVVRVDKHLRAHRSVDGVRAKQAREEQHLGQQEQPDAELAGVELLLRVSK